MPDLLNNSQISFNFKRCHLFQELVVGYIMKKRRLFFSAYLLLLIVICVLSCTAQKELINNKPVFDFPVLLPTTQLIGHLVDSETSQPIKNARLFIGGNSIFSKTDSIGTFHFKNIPLGMHDLMVMLAGYYPLILRIEVSSEFHSPFLLEVPSKALVRKDTCQNNESRVQMLQMQIADLRRKLSKCSEEITLFRNYIIGNQPECRIINPDVIEYERKEHKSGYVVHYQMRHPLLIKNDFLGYHMTVFFKKAVFKELHNIYSIDYYASVHFKEMQPVDEKQMSLWNRNRRSVYDGSFRNFLMALANRQVEQEGFVLYMPPQTNTLGINSLGVASQDPTWSYVHDPYQFIKQIDHETYELNFEGMLRITNVYNDLGSRSRRLWGLTGQGQSSIIQLVDGPVQFNKYGHQTNLVNPNFSEYWKTKQVSELLPLNYKR